MLIELFATARRFDMEVQPSLVLLQKTLLNIEGLGRQLYPDLDLWKTAQPYLEQWLKDRYSPKGIFKQLKRHAPDWLEHFPQIPPMIFQVLKDAQNSNLSKQKIVQSQSRPNSTHIAVGSSFVGGGMLLGLAQWMPFTSVSYSMVVGLIGLGVIILLLGRPRL
jgi:ubiquinone biosynthesis protein